MSLLIIFRKSAPVNRFHDLLIKAIESGEGDSALLCSGFFQEMNNYSAAFDSGLCCALRNNNVSITTIGVHNNQWRRRYVEFRNKLVSCGNNVNAYLCHNYHWHAKVFILKKNDIPIFGIIGSSNMTRNAFGNTVPFNFEADVVLWDINNNAINDLCQSQTQSNTENISENVLDDLVYADYNLERNNGRSAMDKLKEIENEIINGTTLNEL